VAGNARRTFCKDAESATKAEMVERACASPPRMSSKKTVPSSVMPRWMSKDKDDEQINIMFDAIEADLENDNSSQRLYNAKWWSYRMLVVSTIRRMSRECAIV
jgi:hypothetical protein